MFGMSREGMPKRVQQTAGPFVPGNPTIPTLRAAAVNCRGCELWKRGTQTVFGEGGGTPRVMLVGEQPGDQEDIQGRPFVGPAGKLLDRALEAAGIDRQEIYLTNVVKHFKWEPRGKRRIHKKPNSFEITACKPWIEAEIEVLKPQVIVCLGATAAQALLGRQFRVSTQRGEFVPSPLAPYVMTTVHPSSLLRAPEDETRRREIRRFIDDLEHVNEALKKQRIA